MEHTFDRQDLENIFIENEAFKSILKAEQARNISLFAEHIVSMNDKMNLTRILDTKSFAFLHVLDSLSILPLIDKYSLNLDLEARANIVLADVGTGAGFPGMVLKFMREDWKIDLVDALQKRLRFLAEEKEYFDLKKLGLIHARSEDLARSEQHREKYDFVTARAVAKLNVLCEYCLPLVRKGGYFIAMKAGLDTELSEAGSAIKKLAGQLVECQEIILPEVEQNRTLVVIKKVDKCSKIYPRITAKIKQKPL